MGEAGTGKFQRAGGGNEMFLSTSGRIPYPPPPDMVLHGLGCAV